MAKSVRITKEEWVARMPKWTMNLEEYDPGGLACRDSRPYIPCTDCPFFNGASCSLKTKKDYQEAYRLYNREYRLGII